MRDPYFTGSVEVGWQLLLPVRLEWEGWLTMGADSAIVAAAKEGALCVDTCGTLVACCSASTALIHIFKGKMT